MHLRDTGDKGKRFLKIKFIILKILVTIFCFKICSNYFIEFKSFTGKALKAVVFFNYFFFANLLAVLKVLQNLEAVGSIKLVIQGLLFRFNV